MLEEIEVPTVEQIHAYLLARGWLLGESGRAAYLMVAMGYSVRMLHEPTEYDRDEAVFRIALAEGRHPADVRQDILAGMTAPSVPDPPKPIDVRAKTAFLRQRRIDMGLSQREVARRSGIPPSLLSDYENGRHEPTLSKLAAWADALGCDVTITTRPSKENPK